MEYRTLVSADALATLLAGAAPPVVLDCRFDLNAPAAGREAYDRGHIPAAYYLDLDRDLAGARHAQSGRHPLPAADALARRLSALGIGADTQVVAYDAGNGSFAARAWWLLRWLGHPRVAVLDGGVAAWTTAGYSLQAAAAAAPDAAAVVAGRRNDAAVASAADVQHAMSDPHALIVDARAFERYAGSVEPLDTVAGHVPGAVNQPFAANLDATGRFLSAATLRSLWLERLGDVAPHRAIMMCGSGVTACHNLLALEIAGLAGARLYAGSWSEWITDPGRPVARGSADP